MKKVKKAVIPAAGLGTRFLPATKAMPKEMLPIVDKPAIQYIVEEAAASGIEEILIITGKSKRTIEDHFDTNMELEHYLMEHGQEELLPIVQDHLKVSLLFVRQPYPKGLGHAVLLAKAFAGDEPFVVLLGDDIMESDVPLTRQLIDIYQDTQSSSIAVMEVPHEDTQKFGIIDPEQEFLPGLYNVRQFVEKPTPEDAPSNLAIIGRYLLTPEIFPILETLPAGAGGEIQLTDAIDILNQTQRVFAHQYRGKRYDIGSKFGFLEMSVEKGLAHPEISHKLKEYIQQAVEKINA